MATPLQALTSAPYEPASVPSGGSPLSTLVSKPYTPPASVKPAAPASPLSSLTNKPYSAPAPKPVPTAAAKPQAGGGAPAQDSAEFSPYFAGEDPTGVTFGPSDQNDISGKPYFSYRTPGADATTTDYTRVDTTFDPRVAQPINPSVIQNGRMPESVSQPIKLALGGTYSDELDHTIALELAGSNNKANLRIESGRTTPGGESYNFDQEENQLAHAVATGQMSLFDAQYKLASDKAKAGDKNPVPFIDENGQPQTPAPKPNATQLSEANAPIPKAVATAAHDLFSAPDNSTLGTLKNTVLGLPAAATEVGNTINDFGKNLVQGIASMYTNPSETELGMESTLPDIPVVKQIQQGALRTVEPMVESFSSDAAAALILHQPELYNRFVDLAGKGAFAGGGTQGDAGQEILHSMGETPLQVVGDTAQAVLGAYSPSIVGEGLDKAGAVGLKQALGKAALQGGQYGFQYGLAQAASSGSSDPKELGAIVLKSTVGGALLNMGIVGTIHTGGTALSSMFDHMKPLAQSAYEQYKTAAAGGTEKGFVKNPFFRGPESIDSAVQSGDHDLIQNATRQYVDENAGQLTSDYLKRVSDRFNGADNVVSADEAKHVIPGYSGELAPAYHEASSDFAKQHYQGLLDSKKGTGNNTVLFTAGGTGVGKTSALRNMGEKLTEHPIVYDTNLTGEGGVKKVQQALDNGYGARIMYVHRDPVEAFVNGVLPRLNNEDRIVTVDEHLARHMSAPKDVAALQEKFGDKVHLGLVDNSGDKGAIQQVDKLPPIEYDEANLRKQLYDHAQKAKENGQISQEQYDAIVRRNDSGGNKVHQEISGAGPESGQKAEEVKSPVRVSLPPEQDSELGQQIEQPTGPKEIRDTIPLSTPPKYDEEVTEHNGGVLPPINKGGLETPEIDWTKVKDIAALRLSTDTMERNVEKVFGDQADKVNEFLIKPVRANEADRARFVTDLRNELHKTVVKELGIKPGSLESSLVQKYGEGQYVDEQGNLVPYTLSDLQKEAPAKWQDIQKATQIFREEYDQMWQMWNDAREAQGIEPIGKIDNYFRHFSSGSANFLDNFLPTSIVGKIPTSIAGITDYFKSRMPWASPAMRRLGVKTTYDAVGGMDNYLNSASRSIFHTDSVQRGRLLERYLRDTAVALENPDVATENNVAPLRSAYEKAQAEADDAVNTHEFEHLQDKADQAYEDYKQAIADQRGRYPTPLHLGNFAQNLNDWTNLVSGKQARLDRAVESVVGRPYLDTLRRLTRRFGLNVIGGNVSAAATHSIPLVYTLSTVDTPAAFRGLLETLSKPFMQDFSVIGGQQSDFLDRRFARGQIEPSLGEKIATGISSPFRWVDEFISHFAVASKFEEGIAHGLSAEEAMHEADNYAARVIGDRSTGNLPNIMNTKTLGLVTQFQIEVNDNLRVLIHDIPRWYGGSPAKLASAFVKFAVYSYMFNQVLTMIKGSGKGLDPIDLGLTLAGLNDAGRGQSALGRLQSFGTQLSQELPFASLVSQGQIPALTPFITAVQDMMKGQYGPAGTEIASTMLSPIGGGVQALKSYKGILAWRNGVVLDSSGKIISTVPQTVPTLLQGTIFGTNAFPQVKSSNTEINRLYATIQAQQASSKAANAQAASIATDIIGIAQTQGNAAAQAQLLQIADSDPEMAKRVLTQIQNQQKGITKEDTMLKSLGVTNGARAAYIVQKLNGLSTNDEKQQYLLDLANKGILTQAVLTQVLSQI